KILAGVLALSGLLLTATGMAQPIIMITGPEQVIFAHGRDACRAIDIPDSPARAIRDASSQVHLFASHYIEFASVGPSLDNVKRNCQVVFQAAGSDDPARFDNRGWLGSFWTDDGNTVHALVHNEFYGGKDAGACPPVKCWYNAITAAVS